MRHINIPIFIPHLGCPNDCVFCDQRSISGCMRFDEGNVVRQIDEVLTTCSPDDDVEIAFFGGSFTGIERDLMERLLRISDSYIAAGRVRRVRCSTRPDYIDREILRVLGEHSVRTVELGIQSMSDEVLAACRRGHTAEQTREACRAVVEAGFELVGQMMLGLPGADAESERQTARAICLMGASGARVYPTVVWKDTALAEMCLSGEYTPLSDEEAVERTRDVLDIFDRAGVPVIRVGLCSGENLSSPERVVGGASHPAIGELAMGELFYSRICEAIDRVLDRADASGRILTVSVPRGATSRAVGHKRRNILRLNEKYCSKNGINRIKILENSSLIGYNIIIGIL